MQLVPKTGRWMGANNLMNPVQNIAAGTKYLRYLSDRFNGNETNIIAAYNADRRRLVGDTASLEVRPGTIAGHGGRVDGLEGFLAGFGHGVDMPRVDAGE